MAEEKVNGWKSRKLWVGIFHTVVLVDLLVMGYIDSDVFKALFTMNILVMVGGNQGDKWALKKKD